MKAAFSSYTNNIVGGRGIALFLLFLLALYLLATAGITAFAAVCMIPAIAIFVFLALKHQNALFWYIFAINYFVMGLQRYGYIPVQVTVVTVLPQLLLLMAIVVLPRKGNNSLGNPMLIAIILWTFYLVIQVFNHTCGLPISIGDWLTNFIFFLHTFWLAKSSIHQRTLCDSFVYGHGFPLQLLSGHGDKRHLAGIKQNGDG